MVKHTENIRQQFDHFLESAHKGLIKFPHTLCFRCILQIVTSDVYYVIIVRSLSYSFNTKMSAQTPK